MLVSNLEVSGSILMHGGGITGSLLGTASFSLTASNALTASYIIGATATASLADTASFALTASYVDFPTGSPVDTNQTGSITITGSLTVTGSTSLTGSLEVLEYIKSPEISASFISASTIRATSFTGSFTGSARLSGLFSGSFTGSANLSGSFTGSYTGSFIGAARLSGSYTGSFTGSALGTFTGSFSGSGANIFDISASSIIGLNLSRISSGSVTASVSPVEGFVVRAIRSTITGSLTVTGTVSGSFSGSGANLFDISASSIVGLKLNDMSTGSVTASVDATSGFRVTSVASGSLFKGNVKVETGSLTTEYINVGYPSGSGTTGSNVFGTSSWATNVVGNRFINTGSTNAVQAITGSLVITQNLTVQGSSSFTFVTASQILIDQNTLTVFTTGSILPNGGYKVADTGSWDGTGSFLNEGSFLYNTVDKQWTISNKLIVSGNLQVSGAITASRFEGTASLASTASYVNPLTQSVIVSGSLELTGSIRVNSPLIISQSFSSSVSESISGSVTESITLVATNSFTFPNTGSNIFGTSSWAQNAVSAAWAPGGDASATSSYAIEAANKRFVTESAYYAIHPGHVSSVDKVYNHGTYSLNEGKGIYAVGTQSLTDNGTLQVEQFFNKGIFINSGDLQNTSIGVGTGDDRNAVTASYALTSSEAANSVTASFARTASYVLNAVSSSFTSTASSANDFEVRGTLTAQTIVAQTIVAQTITSSVDFVTGSSRFGTSEINTHNFTGSVSITGSFTVTGSTSNGSALFNNTTLANSSNTIFKLTSTAFLSSSRGRDTNRNLLLDYNTIDGFTLRNTAFNASRSATFYVGDEYSSTQITSASLFMKTELFPNAFVIGGRTGSGTDAITLIKSRTIISGSGNFYALLLENAASLDGQRVGFRGTGNPEKDVLRIWGQRRNNSGSIQFGDSGTTNLGIYVTQSSGLTFGTNIDGLCYDSAGGHTFKTGANTLFSVDNTATRVGLHGLAWEINETLTPYQHTLRHMGRNKNIILKSEASVPQPRLWFEINHNYNAPFTNRLEILNQNGNGVTLINNGSSWVATSDERKKDIIEPITNAVAKVEGLRTVIGKFKNDEEGTRRSFFIAQDVVEHFPEAAEVSNPDELGVSYTDLSPLLAAAIKELSQENKELKSELAEIKVILSQLSK